MREVIKRDGTKQEYDFNKILIAIGKAFGTQDQNKWITDTGKHIIPVFIQDLKTAIGNLFNNQESVSVEDIQDVVERILMFNEYYSIAKEYILYREQHSKTRDIVNTHIAFIEKYKREHTVANATVDDNANVRNRSVANMNAEIKKQENILVNRGIVMDKLRELFPDFGAKQYAKDLENRIIYKHDESTSNSGPTLPYCASSSMYQFLLNGIKDLGGLSAAPKNIDSFCGMFCNLVFTEAGQFLGATAFPEALLYFTYFAKKEWGDDFYKNPDKVISINSSREKTIRSQIHQYWQQIIYTINQNSANRGLQAAFTNFSYFDHPFFNGMFENFIFPDGTKPDWESLQWIQKEFMQWFNNERLKVMLPFPVETFALIYKDGKFADEDSYKFVCEELSRGHSFFIYISDTVDSLSSCCRLKNKLQTHEFNFTNGMVGLETGSKSVISLNMNHIVQDWYNSSNIFGVKKPKANEIGKIIFSDQKIKNNFLDYIKVILNRIYKYHIAYNSILHDMYNSDLLPVYKAGFINLNKQYLTIGIVGFSASAEFLGYNINDNKEYQDYCQSVFGFIKQQNQLNRTKTETYNSELVPAESCGAKLYNYDKEHGYWVPNDINLYTSYIFRPYDKNLSVLEKIKMHGRDFIGDELDGGSSAHINLDSHPSYEQYLKIVKFAAEVGCQYFGVNVPNSECNNCGYITKQPITVCPKCGSKHISYWDRIIGYLSKIENWNHARQIEQKTRVYSHYKGI